MQQYLEPNHQNPSKELNKEAVDDGVTGYRVSDGGSCKYASWTFLMAWC